MVRLVVATTNEGKLRELERLLPPTLELETMSSLGIEPPDETGHSFLDNAIIKAQHATRSGYPAIADDSGLEVSALGGAPGVRSARFAGLGASDEENNVRLLAELNGVSARDRDSMFRCAVALALPGGSVVTATGTLSGVIIESPRGNNGFGYDPYFEIHDASAPEALARTLAELPIALKNCISHRARAYRQLAIECSKRADSSPIIAMIAAYAPLEVAKHDPEVAS